MREEAKYKTEYRVVSFDPAGVRIVRRASGDKGLAGRLLNSVTKLWGKNAVVEKPFIVTRVVTTSYSEWLVQK